MDIRKRTNLWRAVFSCMSVMLLQLTSPFVHADGSESLGPPSITIGSGTGIAAAGVLGYRKPSPGLSASMFLPEQLSTRYCCTGKAVTNFQLKEITRPP